jgi:hypothetical protein
VSVRIEMESNESWFICRYSEIEGKKSNRLSFVYSREFMDDTDVWFSRSVMPAAIPVGAI